MTDGLRIAHQVANPEVGNPEGIHKIDYITLPQQRLNTHYIEFFLIRFQILNIIVWHCQHCSAEWIAEQKYEKTKLRTYKNTNTKTISTFVFT